jgi:uncharacterized protein (TIGR03083 family)
MHLLEQARALTAALRRSHEGLTALVKPLDGPTLRSQSYDTEWSVHQVLSHLGSQAELYQGWVSAGLEGRPMPGRDTFPAVWAKWDAMSPEEHRGESAVANATLVERFEGLTDDEIANFSLDFFGTQTDGAGIIRSRLAEHAVHSWDVAVTLDPHAMVDPVAVSLVFDQLDRMAAWSGKPGRERFSVLVRATEPRRTLVVDVGDTVQVRAIANGEAEPVTEGAVELPAEAWLRLVYGRLDEAHTPTSITSTGTRGVADLRAVFLGI